MSEITAIVQSWNWVDWLMVIILLLSAGVSIARGFVRETFSLVVWILAMFNAYLLGDEMATILGHWVSKPSLRVTVGMAVLFVMTLAVGALLNHVLAEMVKKGGLTAADRILGLFFGVARGVIIIMALTLYMPVSVKQTHGWSQSRLAPSFIVWEARSRQAIQGIGNYVHGLFTA